MYARRTCWYLGRRGFVYALVICKLPTRMYTYEPASRLCLVAVTVSICVK